MSNEILARLIDAYAAGGSSEALADYLTAHSRLPGPRSNLELAAECAVRAGTQVPVDRLVSLIDTLWLSPNLADTNDPRSFLPFVAAQVAGVALANGGGPCTGEFSIILRRAANDPRWRVREGAAMGLQHVGDREFGAMLDIARGWGTELSLLELRAIVAGIAEPRLLRDQAVAREGWVFFDQAVSRLYSMPKDARRTDEFQALRKGLGYAISVLTAADPEGGFDRLAAWSLSADKDVIWVVRENLKKKRLRGPYPKETAGIAALLARSV